MIQRAIDPEFAYLALRLVSLSLLFAAGVLLYLAATVIAGKTAAYLIPILLISSPFVRSIAEEIGNTPMALFFLSAAIYVHFAKRSTLLTNTVVGAMIGLAAKSKLNFALYALPFGIFIAANHGLVGRETLSYVLGGIFGSALIWFYLLSDPNLFWFYNIEFHYLTNQVREIGPTQTAAAVLMMLVAFSVKSLPQLILYGAAAFYVQDMKTVSRLRKLTALLAVSVIAALLPGYFAPQYLAPAGLILALMTSIGANVLAQSFAQRTNLYWGAIFGVILLAALPAAAQNLLGGLKGFTQGKVAAFTLQNMQARIEYVAQAHLDARRCDMSAVSLGPIPFIGTSFNITRYSATGPFMPRIRDHNKLRNSPPHDFSGTEEALVEIQPTVLLVGYYPQYPSERAMRRYAEENGFIAFEIGHFRALKSEGTSGAIQLLVRASCMEH
ncbi:MAG: hypothetical protein AAFW60_07815 [Pseudomonadota bacterium]